ncbi:hypothetical protein KSP39_PZI021178 [Platanthera zijinensis]|uniref:Uncharacterized protein n=1 Tax=Platanthera zijinensis TaxID=2320716 RepID=A0AAP0AX96_9ASPA
MGRKADRRLLLSSPGVPASDAVKSITADPDMTQFATSGISRRQPVILKKSSRKSPCVAEIAGGKTAECAAILCCCPCGLLDLLILAVVRLPAGLCRKALRKRFLRRRTKRAKLLESSSGLNSESSVGSGSGTGSDGCSSAFGSSSDDEFAEFAGFRGTVVMVVGDSFPAKSPSAEVIELEEEVWSKFYSSGFWRSPSLAEGRSVTAQID